MMTKHRARITAQDGSWYAFIVRIDKDLQETVIHGYKGRFFKTFAAAEKSTSAYIKKMGAA